VIASNIAVRLFGLCVMIIGMGTASARAQPEREESSAPVEDTAAASQDRAGDRPAPPVAASPGGDHLGFAIVSISDLDGDHVREIIVGAYAFDSTGDNAGGIFVVSGRSGDTLMILLGEHAGDDFGAFVTAPGDIDRDGTDDLAVTAPNWDGGDSAAMNVGKVYVYSGADGSLLLAVEGNQTGGRFGLTMAPAGDVNGDRIGDLAVAQFRHGDDPDRSVGVVWIISGADGARIHLLTSGGAHDRFGRSVASAGDVDGDGTPDVVVGAYRDSRGGLSAGAVYVFSGRTGQTIHVIAGDRLLGHFGYAVGGGEDIDGDGRGDILVGARFDDSLGRRSGRVYLYSGRDGRRLAEYAPPGAGEQFGSSVGFIGDVDGDAVVDIAIGAVRGGKRGEITGRVYVFSGRTGALIVTLSGEGGTDGFGQSLAAPGDIDGDGAADLLVGASGYDASGKDAGRVYCFSSRSGTIIWTMTGTSTLALDTPADSVGGTSFATLETLRAETNEFGYPIFDTTEVDVAPVIRRSVAAEYPSGALGSGLTGWVYVKVLVRPDGYPERIEIEDDSGLGPEFRQAAVATANQWQFLAANRGGEAVACWAVFPIGFAPPSTADDSAAAAAQLDSAGAHDTLAAPADTLGGDSLAVDSVAADTAVATGPYEVDEVDVQPVLIARVDPQYPPAARLAGESAIVTMRVLVHPNGGVVNVESIEATPPDMGFEGAAAASVRRWRYEPGEKSGQKVSVWVTETVAFEQPEPDEPDTTGVDSGGQ